MIGRFFKKYDDINNVIRKVCKKENIPFIEAVEVLMQNKDDEIGFNAFMDDFHMTLKAHQILAKTVLEKMSELHLLNCLNERRMDLLEEGITSHERLEDEQFPYNSESLALIGWQKLIMMKLSSDPKRTRDEIISIANKAIAQNSSGYHNYHSYILLGTIYSPPRGRQYQSDMAEDENSIQKLEVRN